MFLSKLFGKRNLRLKLIPTDDILPNPHRARRETDETALAMLCESVRRNGILEPLAVQPAEDGQYRVISGERRLAAARIVGFAKVPCLIFPKKEALAFIFPLVHSLHSLETDVFEQGAAIRNMMDSLRLSRSAAAALLGITETALSLRLCALRLNDIQRRRALEAGLDLRQIRAVAEAELQKRDKILDILTDTPRRPQKEKEAENEPRQKINGAADLRFFDNSLNRMVDSMCAAGLKASWECRNGPLCTEYVIRVSKDRPYDRQLTLF